MGIIIVADHYANFLGDGSAAIHYGFCVYRVISFRCACLSDQGLFSSSCYMLNMSGGNRIPIAFSGQSCLQDPQCQHSSGYFK